MISDLIHGYFVLKETKNLKTDHSGLTADAFTTAFKMGGSLSLIVKLFGEVVADDLPQEQLLRGVDDEATLLLLVPWSRRKKRHVHIITTYQKSSKSLSYVKTYCHSSGTFASFTQRHTSLYWLRRKTACRDKKTNSSDLFFWILSNPECLRFVANRFDVCSVQSVQTSLKSYGEAPDGWVHQVTFC